MTERDWTPATCPKASEHYAMADCPRCGWTRSSGRSRTWEQRPAFALDADVTVYWPDVRPCWEQRGPSVRLFCPDCGVDQPDEHWPDCAEPDSLSAAARPES